MIGCYIQYYDLPATFVEQSYCFVLTLLIGIHKQF